MTAYNDVQLEAAKSETFTANLNDFIAKYQGGANSPNLPVGNWEFKMDEDGNLFVETLESARDKADGSGKATYDVCYVYPKGNPEGTQRRVYTSALVAPTAKAILYKDGKLKRTAEFGVFSSNANGVRTTTVSKSADDVNKGIAKANADYAKERAAKAAAAEIGG